ncbi:MAG: hypothetical protein ACPGNT_06040 [Rhodospirillales bacterium]
MRIFFQYILPLLLPTLGYLAFVWVLHKTGRRDGQPDWARGPWYWLIAAGVVLAILSMLAFAGSSGLSETDQYHSPRWDGQRIVPSGTDP